VGRDKELKKEEFSQTPNAVCIVCNRPAGLQWRLLRASAITTIIVVVIIIIITTSVTRSSVSC
jgi:uncharacterized integral membrane protein